MARALHALHGAVQVAQVALDAGELEEAVSRGCAALALCEDSGVARLPLLVLISAALGRMGRFLTFCAVTVL